MCNIKSGVRKKLMSFKMVYESYKKFFRNTKQESGHFKSRKFT